MLGKTYIVSEAHVERKIEGIKKDLNRDLVLIIMRESIKNECLAEVFKVK
jgi:hypothetical protein